VGPARITPAAARRRALGIAAIVAAGALGVLALPPIPQDPRYHAFADQRRGLGIPHALNVVSNLPFLVVGAWGLAFLRRERPRPNGPMASPWERGALGVMFSGVALTGVGSAVYHLDPTSGTLVWDRLPITVVAMTLLAIAVAERISLPAARRLLPALLVVGAGSVLWWHAGELRGAGDLRLYGLVQFAPMVAILLMLWLFPPRYTRGADWLVALGWYALARVFESLDAPVFALGQVVSGHTLKHLASAVAIAWLARMFALRRPVT